MPTLRQRKVAKRVKQALENGEDITGGELLKSVDYGTGLQRSPGRVLQSEGVQEALEDLGFSIQGADEVVKNILYKSKREDMKLRAADMIYKRRGAYEDTKQGAGKALILVLPTEIIEKNNIQSHTDIEGS
jgi:hypothetical protein